MPQSRRRRLFAASIRYLEPVTVPAAPRKVSLGIGVPLYRNCGGVKGSGEEKGKREKEAQEKDNAETRRSRSYAEKAVATGTCREGAQHAAPLGGATWGSRGRWQVLFFSRSLGRFADLGLWLLRCRRPGRLCRNVGPGAPGC